MTVLSLAFLSASPAAAQRLLAPSDAADANRRLSSISNKSTLRCDLYQNHPVLDLTFQFAGGYSLRCPVAQFEGNEMVLTAYLRITPDGGPPVLLSESYRSRPLAREALTRRNSGDLAFAATGGYIVGEGKYSVEFFLVDQRGRFYRKEWSISAARDMTQRGLPVINPPNAVLPLTPAVWDDQRIQKEHGLRITIFLDAAPINWRQAKLYDWDRSFLLNGLVSLLQQIPCRSLRIIAFNLDQQRQIFQQDHLDRAGFDTLSRSLESFDTWTVPLKTLKPGSQSAFIRALATTEFNSPSQSDVVIFFGPMQRPRGVSPPIPSKDRAAVPLFYLEWTEPLMLLRSGEFPDAIDDFTKKVHGRVFRIHSAGEFAKRIHELNQLTSHDSSKPADPGGG